MTIEARVNREISNQMGVDVEDIKPDSNFEEELGADSLDQVELVMALEEEFGLEISDEEAEKLDTPQAVVGWLKSQGVADG